MTSRAVATVGLSFGAVFAVACADDGVRPDPDRLHVESATASMVPTGAGEATLESQSRWGSVSCEPAPAGSDAVRFLEPVASEAPGASQDLDATLLPFVEVAICAVEAAHDEPVVGFRSEDGSAGGLLLSSKQYMVNFSPPEEGGEFEVRVFVAGLLAGQAAVATDDARAVPIRFRIENQPVLRARVLTEQHLSATEVAEALAAEFGSTPELAALLLAGEDFDATAISSAMLQVFSLDAGETAVILQTVGFTAEDAAEGLVGRRRNDNAKAGTGNARPQTS